MQSAKEFDTNLERRNSHKKTSVLNRNYFGKILHLALCITKYVCALKHPYYIQYQIKIAIVIIFKSAIVMISN